jgi:hypothetical protein
MIVYETAAGVEKIIYRPNTAAPKQIDAVALYPQFIRERTLIQRGCRIIIGDDFYIEMENFERAKQLLETLYLNSYDQK